MNEMLLFVSIIGVFTSILLIKRLFGKDGLIGYMAVATILAEIGVAKSVNILGLSATLGNVLFASNFLVTDILAECYGEKEAKKGIKFAIFSVILFIIIMQIMLLFKPNDLDFAQESMKILFGIVPRISIASIIMLTISNLVDVKLYMWLKKKTNNKYMWLRNNLSTILCNGLENFFFTTIAFIGIYNINDILVISLATTIIEIIIAICDTPFLYISKKIKD